MEESLLAVIISTLICFALQLLPLITVPITNPSQNLYLSTFNNFTFGVFGLCDLTSGECSKSAIGYPSKDSKFFVSIDSTWESQGIQLPSETTYTVSKLLVVHVVSFTITAVLLILELILLILDHYNKIMKSIKGNEEQEEDEEEEEEEEEEAEVDPMLNDNTTNKSNRSNSSTNKKKRKSYFNLSPCLDSILCLTLIAFLSTLLAFLADVLLFVDTLTWIGWIQLFPLLCFAFISTFICFLKRNLSTRRYLEDSRNYENDEMRTRKNAVISRWNDDASDDGFYVYTKGFFSSNGYNDTPDPDSVYIQVQEDDGSIDSHENIEMDVFDVGTIHDDTSQIRSLLDHDNRSHESTRRGTSSV